MSRPETPSGSWFTQGTPERAIQEEAEELLDEAAALEDYAARLLAESADLENEALERVASFEKQRLAVMRAQARLHAAEVRGPGLGLLPLAHAFLHQEERKRWIWRQAECRWEKSRQRVARANAKREKAESLRQRALRLLEEAASGREGEGQGGAELRVAS